MQPQAESRVFLSLELPAPLCISACSKPPVLQRANPHPLQAQCMIWRLSSSGQSPSWGDSPNGRSYYPAFPGLSAAFGFEAEGPAPDRKAISTAVHFWILKCMTWQAQFYFWGKQDKINKIVIIRENSGVAVKGGMKKMKTEARWTLGLEQQRMYSGLLLSMGGTFQDPQWMPEATDSIQPYVYWYVFSYTYIPMIEFNL